MLVYNDVEWTDQHQGRWRMRRGVEIPGARNTRITAENAKRTVTYWRSGKWDLDIESVNDDLISENTMHVHLVGSLKEGGRSSLSRERTRHKSLFSEIVRHDTYSQ